jgi:hypothetical protein
MSQSILLSLLQMGRRLLLPFRPQKHQVQRMLQSILLNLLQKRRLGRKRLLQKKRRLMLPF